MTVSFNSEEYSEKYTVSVQCPDFRDSQTVWKVTLSPAHQRINCCKNNNNQ
uniref:Uncharacterized protein n=1 Tax=Anguilla anguilla TaxID=7936 RepID=A0A0E9UPT5_ANGAN